MKLNIIAIIAGKTREQKWSEMAVKQSYGLKELHARLYRFLTHGYD